MLLFLIQNIDTVNLISGCQGMLAAQTARPWRGGIDDSCLVRAVKHAKMQAVTGRRLITKINKRASKDRVNDKWHIWREDRWKCEIVQRASCRVSVASSCTESVDLDAQSLHARTRPHTGRQKQGDPRPQSVPESRLIRA